MGRTKSNKKNLPPVVIDKPKKSHVESYKYVVSGRNYGLYAERARFLLGQVMFDYIKKLNLKGRKEDGEGCIKYEIQEDMYGGEARIITFDMRLICPDRHDFSNARKQLEDMFSLHFTYEDEHVWQAVHLFSKIKVDKGSWMVSFHTTSSFWEILNDFSGGFRKPLLEEVMKFKSPYSMRFYELVARERKPMVYDIDRLRIMFGVDGKYQTVEEVGEGKKKTTKKTMKNSDFIRWVVDGAKRELDEISPWSFDYEVKYQEGGTQGRGRPKIEKVIIRPLHITGNDADELASAEHLPITVINKDALGVLKETYGFTDKEIQCNVKDFITAQDLYGLGFFLRQIEMKSRRSRKGPKAYVIGAVRRQNRQKGATAKAKNAPVSNLTEKQKRLVHLYNAKYPNNPLDFKNVEKYKEADWKTLEELIKSK